MPDRTCIHGNWSSRAPERIDRPDGTTVYVDKKFTFDPQRWRIVFTVSNDIEGVSKLFSGDFSGSYAIEDYVPLIDSYRARFLFSQRLITVHQAGLIDTLQSSARGAGAWTLGIGKDVDQAGCAAL